MGFKDTQITRADIVSKYGWTQVNKGDQDEDADHEKRTTFTKDDFTIMVDLSLPPYQFYFYDEDDVIIYNDYINSLREFEEVLKDLEIE